MIDQLKPYAKAVIACLIAGLGALAVALEDGVVSQVEAVTIAIAALSALGGTWAVPNRPHPDMAVEEIEAQSIQERDA